jgi:hypothetical protein
MLIYWKHTYYNGNTEASIVVSKENGLKANADRTKYMIICRDQNAG